MRYCEACGYVMDEFNSYRECENCPVCRGVFSEDDMTALRYAKLSELEKDAYDEQLLETIQNSPKFGKFEYNCSPQNGNFWRGFRIEKYLQFEHEEEIVENVLNRRKANEPFKPFPKIDMVKAREVAKDAELVHKAIDRGYYSQNTTHQENIPKCPTCQSTNIEKISLGKKAVGGALFGLFSSNVRKTFNCKNCGYKW